MTPAPDLYALIIRLAAVRGGGLRATQGHLAHAAFLDMLRAVDPALAAAVHDLPGRKPFTISPLEGFGRGRDGRLTIREGGEGWLRVTLLDPTLFRTFIRFFLEGGPRLTLRLEEMEFGVSEVLSTPHSHPLAGHVALAELAERWDDAPLNPAHGDIALCFRSPTAFSLRDPAGRFRYAHVLPDPPLVFGELAGYWDRLTGAATQAEVRDFAAAGVAVARHDVATHMYDYGGGRKQVGFVGRVAFKLLDDSEPALARHLNRLADLAFFTGIGSKTTMGMGQVNRVTNDERRATSSDRSSLATRHS